MHLIIVKYLLKRTIYEIYHHVILSVFLLLSLRYRHSYQHPFLKRLMYSRLHSFTTFKIIVTQNSKLLEFWVLMFSHPSGRGFRSCAVWCCVGGKVVCDVSKEHTVSILIYWF